MAQQRRKRIRAATTLAAFGMMVAGPAMADDRARADALFQQGRAAAVAGDYGAARAKFAESQRLDPAVGTLLNIAECEDHLQHPAAALSVFRFALPQLDPSDSRFAITKARIDALEKRAPRLTVVLAARVPPSARVSRDGVELDSRDLGVPASVEPGPHTVTLHLEGTPDQTTNVTLREGQAETLVLAPASSSPRPATASSTAEWLDSPRARGGLIALGVSGIGFALGAVSWGEIRTANRASDRATDAEAARAAKDDGATWNVLSYVGWGLGIGGLGAATFLLLTSEPSKPHAVKVDVAPRQGGAFLSALAHF